MNERSLFLKALELKNPAERAAFLDQECANNIEMRRRIESLLKAYSKDAGIVDALAGDNHPTTGMPDEKKKTVDDDETVDLGFLGPGTSPDSIGSIGSFDVLEVIGRGGMGLVLKARDIKLQRIVAIKVLAPEIATNKTAKKRFEREALAAAAVSHDHIVTIYAVDEFNNLPYLVMECIVGRSLQQKIEETGPLELKEILRIGMQAAQGLAAAHKQGLVHRDIKPANILLQNGIQRVKITDFGLARATDDVGMTQTGQIAGTPLYMSPEQAQGQKVDHTSDLFSLGSVLYTMATGRPAFRAPSTVAVLRRVVDDTPRPIHEINEELPSWLGDIISKLMSKKKEDRFQTAAELADLLSRRLARLQEPRSSTSTKSAALAPAKPKIEPGRKSAVSSKVTSASRVAAAPRDDEELLELPERSRRVKPVRKETMWDRIRNASPLTWLVAGVLVPGMIALVVMMAMLLNRDQLLVRIELDESLRQQDVTLVIDGTAYAARDLGPSIRVKPGPHTLEVKRGNEQFKSEQFTIFQNEKPLFRVKTEGGKLSVERADPGTTPIKLAEANDSKAPEAAPQTARTDTPEYKRFVEWMKSRGGSVGPEFPPDGSLPHMVTLAIEEAFTPEDIDHFRDLPGVQNMLVIASPKMTTRDMVQLGKMMQGKPIGGGTGIVNNTVGLDWLKEPGGFINSCRFTFQNCNAKSEQLAPLKNFPNLGELNLRFNKDITDDAIVHLQELKKLAHLALDGTGITEAGMARLRVALPNCEIVPKPTTGSTSTTEYKRFVEWMTSRGGSVTPPFPPNGELPHQVHVHIDGTFKKVINDSDLENFKDLPGVHEINIRAQSITSKGMVRLGQLMQNKPLSSIVLLDMHMGLDWLQEPGGLSELKLAVFQNVNASDDQLPYLANLPKLEAIALNYNPKITDAGIEHLRKFTNLKSIDLTSCGLTESGIARLRSLLPACRILPVPPVPAGVTGTPEFRAFVEWVKSRGGSVNPEVPTNGELPHMVELHIDPAKRRPISDEDIDRFRDLPGLLNGINMRSQAVTTDGLIRLGKIMADKPIGQIFLVDMPVGLDWLREPGGFSIIGGATFQNINAKDDQLKNLKKLSRLSYINLKYNKDITDKAIDYFIEHKSLETIHLDDSGVSPAGLARLRAARPELKVTPLPPENLR